MRRKIKRIDRQEKLAIQRANRQILLHRQREDEFKRRIALEAELKKIKDLKA